MQALEDGNRPRLLSVIEQDRVKAGDSKQEAVWQSEDARRLSPVLLCRGRWRRWHVETDSYRSGVVTIKSNPLGLGLSAVGCHALPQLVKDGRELDGYSRCFVAWKVGNRWSSEVRTGVDVYCRLSSFTRLRARSRYEARAIAIKRRKGSRGCDRRSLEYLIFNHPSRGQKQTSIRCKCQTAKEIGRSFVSVHALASADI